MAGESPQATAVRENLEETGYRCDIVATIPGEFVGGTTSNKYFLMRSRTGQPEAKPDPNETEDLCWAEPAEAETRIRLTRNKKGQKRDLAVLAAALDMATRAGLVP